MLVIPEDAVADILSRLPVKPLLRFRCVRKSWRDLIDSPTFIKSHLIKTKELQSHRKLIHLGHVSEIYSLDFDAITRTNIVDVVGVTHPFGPSGIINCCNGLVCVSKPDGLAIWNPSTRRYQMLPRLDTWLLVNARDQGRGRHRWFCGFGYDVLSDDYKVVFNVQSESDFEKPFSSKANIYSLKLNSWRQIKPLPYCLKDTKSSGEVACGALHCVVGKSKDCGNQWIAAFDLATEEYRIVPQPNYPSKVDFYMHLGSLGGCLSLMWGYRNVYVDIWVLKEYGKHESWTKITRINALAFSDKTFGFMRTVEYSVGGKELILEKNMNSMVRFDIEKKLAKNVEIRGQTKYAIRSEMYQESLVQLKNGCPSVPRKEVAQNSKKVEQTKKRDKFLSKGFKLVL